MKNIENKTFRIAILSQDDSFVIPKNILKLNKIKFIEIVLVVSLDTKGSLVNKKTLFIKGFGIVQSIKMAIIIGIEKFIDRLDALFQYSKYFKPRSLISSAKRCGALHLKIENPNDVSFLNTIKKMHLDLIVSFSAPSVFKNELLNIPKSGCINLHCSLLPKYAGLLPSFWTLYENQNTIGASVHYMDDRIDNGQILGQVKVETPKKPSMFKIIKLTKDIGGDLMCDVIRSFYNQNLRPKQNKVNEGSYFTWPSIEQIRKFRNRGGRLI